MCIYFTYMIGLTKRSHVAPKMQHVTFCDSIVRFDWCRTKRIDSVCGVTWIPLCARDGSVIAWGRGEGETLSHHVVSTQCAVGFNDNTRHFVIFSYIIYLYFLVQNIKICIEKYELDSQFVLSWST